MRYGITLDRDRERERREREREREKLNENKEILLIYRLFWLIFCALSWYGCANMIENVVRNYIQYPIALTTETTYLDWQTPFPTVAFCFTVTSPIKKLFKGYVTLKIS